jgi:hypothetical protein
MGKKVGAFSEKEVKHLGAKHRSTLEKEALRHIRTSPEIEKIIRAHPKVRKLLKAKLAATHSRLTAKAASKK